MNEIWNEIRLFICEKLLSIILKIVPADTKDGIKLIQAIKDYVGITLTNFSDNYMEDVEESTNKILERW